MPAEPQVSDAPEPGSTDGDDLFAELTSEPRATRRRPSSPVPTFLDPPVKRPAERDGRSSSGTAAGAHSIFSRAADAPGVDEQAEPDGDTAGRAGSDGRGSQQSRREVKKAARLEARKVHRVVRHVDAWSVFKVSAVFYLCLWLILVIAGTILWRVAVSAGAIDNVENFVAELLAEKSFTIDGAQVLRAAAVAGAVLVFAGTGFTVLLALLFNLISDLTGGLRFSVIEMETARPAEQAGRRRQQPGRPRRRRRVAR